jgi:transcriptional regulator with XRE-family HTH domain
MATRKSGVLDAMVGARIRMLRVNRGISVSALAARIGVSFQQLQQYEQGAGRVGASRLARIAAVLDVPVGDFFESSRAFPPGSQSPVRLLGEPGVRRILEAYQRLSVQDRCQPGAAGVHRQAD